jgi:hypothetical protein
MFGLCGKDVVAEWLILAPFQLVLTLLAGWLYKTSLDRWNNLC